MPLSVGIVIPILKLYYYTLITLGITSVFLIMWGIYGNVFWFQLIADCIFEFKPYLCLFLEHVFAIIWLGFVPRVLPHIDVCLAVCFLRRVHSSDYIDCLLGDILWKGVIAYANNKWPYSCNCTMCNLLQSWLHAWAAWF